MKRILMAVVAAPALLFATCTMTAPAFADNEPVAGPAYNGKLEHDVPLLCAVDLIDSMSKKQMGSKADHINLEKYVKEHKLTDEQITKLANDCYMFTIGAQFVILSSTLSEEEQEAPEPQPLYNS